ncbi:MucBP domain-containing protein [Listeria monocytogenes]|nr:MucBP domain-containing protein [Listeria monocytogenes]EHZ7802629.1 MucBP domain-containing protein [Listeria monocytogenes]EHZ7811332.1 MucBP domain-containing protein [Listeria monocytogenes]EJH4993806.1 MucBP domain-containing protein [Listeria monocytogenes]EJH5102408.1 MucBP domain-containing protein [Listeria monocytogenes]
MKKYSYLLLIVIIFGLNPITGRAEENVNTDISKTTEQETIPDVNVVDNTRMVESNDQAGEHRENDEYKYRIVNYNQGDGDMVILEEYIGSSKDVVIPSEIDGFPVKHIGTRAFEDKKLNNVVIPEGITYIEAWAFALNNFYSIKLPNSLRQMSLQAFAACHLSDISMPDDVKMEGSDGKGDQFYNQNAAIRFSRGKKITLDKLFKFDSGPITLGDIDIVSIDEPTVTFEDGEFKIPQEIKQFTFRFSSHTKYGEGFYSGKYRVYIRDTVAEPLLIKYVDQSGVEIHEQQTISGNIGDSYDASTDAYKLVIDGYTLDKSKLPDNTTGTLSDTGQTVTYTYIKDGTQAKDATVRYLDQEGSDIHKPQTISGNIGDSYDASTDTYKLLIDGYTLDESKLPDNAIGILSDIDQTVTYTYTKDSVKAQDVTVRYLDQEGKDIHKPQTISGNIGDSYDASTDAYKLSIADYTLDKSKLPENMTGILSDTEQVITYVYNKNEGIVEPSQPANPVKPTESKPTATTKPKVESTHILPRTGEQALAWASGIGIVLVVAVGFIFYKKRQSNSN